MLTFISQCEANIIFIIHSISQTIFKKTPSPSPLRETTYRYYYIYNQYPYFIAAYCCNTFCDIRIANFFYPKKTNPSIVHCANSVTLQSCVYKNCLENIGTDIENKQLKAHK